MIADLAINEALASGEKSFNLNNTVYNARKVTCNSPKATINIIFICSNFIYYFLFPIITNGT